MSEIDFNVFDKSSLVYVGKVLRNKILNSAVGINIEAMKFMNDDDGFVSISILDETKAIVCAEIGGSASWTGPEQKSVVSTAVDSGYDVSAVASRQVKISFLITSPNESAIARLYDAAANILSERVIPISYNNGDSVYDLRGIVSANPIVKNGNRFEATIQIEGFISTVSRRFLTPSKF